MNYEWFGLLFNVSDRIKSELLKHSSSAVLFLLLSSESSGSIIDWLNVANVNYACGSVYSVRCGQPSNWKCVIFDHRENFSLWNLSVATHFLHIHHFLSSFTINDRRQKVFLILSLEHYYCYACSNSLHCNSIHRDEYRRTSENYTENSLCLW